MSDLTDLEICKRIAEIDGAFKVVEHGMAIIAFFKVGSGIHTYESSVFGYNPLTDDALCFQLMIKHEVRVLRYYKLGDLEAFYGAERDLEEVEDRSPNRAICIAIIEANKEKS